MSETIPTHDGAQDDDTSPIHFVRHGQARYKPYVDVLGGPTPEQPMDYGNQPEADLTVEGRQHAEQKANELFEHLNPETDALFIVTSPERRTIDTAEIYRQVAKRAGFEVLAPDHTRSDLANEISEGEVRVVHALSTKIENVLVSMVFGPKQQYDPSWVNWDVVKAATRKQFNAARQVIEADDRGSWINNYVAHSESIKKMFPKSLTTAQERYEKDFNNLVRLAKFGVQKSKDARLDKSIKILAFGHENHLAVALENFFGDHDLLNCETLAIDVENGHVNILRRGKSARIDTQ